MTIQAYQFAGGYGTVAVPNPPIQAPRDPATTDIVSPAGNPYQIGQYWQNKITGTVFFYIGAGLWETVAAPTLGPIDTVTGNSGGAIGPTLNNVNILGAGALAFAGAGTTLTGTITPGTALADTLTGDSGGALSPTAGNFNILGGTGCNTSGSGSTLTINVTGMGEEYTTVTANTPMAINQGYITNKAVTAAAMTLPAVAAVGSAISILGRGATGWSIVQNAGQTIRFGATSSTTGAGGSAASTSQYQSISLVCIIANTDWIVQYTSDVLTIV